MEILDTFYERLTIITEKKGSLTIDQLQRCYDVFKETIEIGNLHTESYKNNLHINPSTSLVFQKIDKHPLFPITIYVCVGIDSDGKLLPININHVMVCQANGWFYDVGKLSGLSIETESFYGVNL